MMEISGNLGMSALTDQSYLYNERMNLLFGGLQCLILMTTVFISIFKPWKKKSRIHKACPKKAWEHYHE